MNPVSSNDEPLSQRLFRQVGIEQEPKPRPEPTTFTEYWAHVDAVTGETKWRPMQHELPAPNGDGFYETEIQDAMAQLPGLVDDPCPWEYEGDGLYANAETGQRFRVAAGSAGGTLYTPGSGRK